MTIVLPVDPCDPQPDAIARAAEVIRAGGLVAFPTETVYGLGANGLDAAAAARIFEAKRRPANDPLILHLASTDQLIDITIGAPPLARRLADAFWPGPLTLVLERGPRVPGVVTAGGGSVAVRVPAHPVARALIAAARTPVAAPSANLFGRPSPTSAEDVLEDLRGRIDLVLDGGPTTIGIESTVLSLVGAEPVLLRPGGLPLERIEALIGPVLLPGEAAVEEGQRAPAPGMLLKHYSPRARLLYVLAPEAGGPPIAALRREAGASLARGERLGLLLCDAALDALADIPAERAALGGCGDLAGVAARLFGAMRALDRAGVDAILTHGYGRAGLGRALDDRLFRAAEGRTISSDE
jgi:L-threonylcarbamoyladenylate synthase